MSLFSAMHLGSNALRAQQIGIQVTGQNIANANTPGYIREEVLLVPAPTQRLGNLLLGLGVEVSAVVQKIDLFLEERLRGATSDRAGSEVKEEAYTQLEAVVGELSDTDLSTSLNNFFSSIHEVLNQPESVAVRNLAVLKGKTLADDIRRLYSRVSTIRDDADQQLSQYAANVNRLTEEIAKLNVQIAEAEGGDVSPSDAVGLRDRRQQALTNLAELIDIRVEDQRDGTVTIFVEGDFLVFQGQSRTIEAVTEQVEGRNTTSLKIAEIDAPLDVSGGKAAGQIAARDEVFLDFLHRLDDFTQTLAFEFNRLFSSGQGLRGYQNVTSEFSVNDADDALDATGLSYTPVNGSLQVLVYNKQTKLTKTTDITIDLNGLGHDTTLSDFAAALNAIDGVAATVTPTGKLQITSESSESEFAFNHDTSGVLAALGVATFFTGRGAADLGVNAQLTADPGRFAASKEGFGVGTGNAVLMANFIDQPLESVNGSTLGDLYDRLIGETTQASGVAKSIAEGFRVFEETLHGQKLGISGVSLDEEAVRLITYQRAFQATARYIATVSELLEVLVNL